MLLYCHPTCLLKCRCINSSLYCNIPNFAQNCSNWMKTTNEKSVSSVSHVIRLIAYQTYRGRHQTISQHSVQFLLYFELWPAATVVEVTVSGCLAKKTRCIKTCFRNPTCFYACWPLLKAAAFLEQLSKLNCLWCF